VSAAPRGQPPVDYRFGAYRFDGRLRRLFKDGEPVALTTKAIDTLAALLERAGRVVDKDELLHVVWNEVVVGEETLAQNISTLRRALGDDPSRPIFIATVARRGYRFVAPVEIGRPDAPGDESARAEEPAPRRARWRLALVGGLGLAVVVAVLAVRWPSPHSPPAPLVEFTIGEPESARFADTGGMLALSPDGQYLTFLATDSEGLSSIWLRPLRSSTVRRLDGTEGVIQMFWSPDSRDIAFFADRRLKAVSVASGAVRIIATLTGGRMLGGSWGRAGQLLFSVPTEGLYTVPAAGGSPELVAPFDAVCTDCASWPHFLPDGRRFLYTVAGSEPSAGGIYVGEIGRAGSRRLIDVVSSATFIPPDLVSYVQAGTLYGQRVDPASLALRGAPLLLADGVAFNARTGRALAATSEAGVLAFRRPLVAELVWVDRGGREIAVATPPGTYLNFSVAPDGQHVAVAQLDPGPGTSDIWVYGPGSVARVTEDFAWDGDPIWSPDGRRVLYSSRRDGQWGIYQRPAMGVGPEELVVGADVPIMPLQVLPAGQLVYGSRQWSDLWLRSAEGSAPLSHGIGFYSTDVRLSSDGGWLAYGAQDTVYVSGSPYSSDRRPIAEGASVPRWRQDGRELFYLSRDLMLVSAPVNPPQTPGESPARTLFRTLGMAPTGITGQVYDAAPDGQRFLLKREVRSSPILVVLNWQSRVTQP